VPTSLFLGAEGLAATHCWVLRQSPC